MGILLKLAFLFFIGSMIGWGIEVLFRRFFSAANPERRWINPGFLVGPYLPLYGFGLCLLYLIAQLELLLPAQSAWANKLLLFVLMAICMTAIEYVAGLIFIRGMHVKLWDYSGEWGNIQGIICPKFSFFWAVLGAAYYFLVHPHILGALRWLSENLAFSFVIGFFFGVFLIDFTYSAKLLSKIRAFATDHEVVVKYEELRDHIRKSRAAMLEKKRFFLSLHSSVTVTEQLKQLYENLLHRNDTQEQKK